MEKHSIMVFGHRTSFTLESEFWAELKEIAKSENITLSTLIERIDNGRTGHLSSAIRIYVLRTLKQKVIENKYP